MHKPAISKFGSNLPLYISTAALVLAALALAVIFQSRAGQHPVDIYEASQHACAKEYADIRAEMAGYEKTDPSSARAYGENSGVIDGNGHVVSDTVWVAACVEERKPIYP